MLLTAKLVEDEQPGPKTRIIWDSRVKGLGLRITPAGVKSFILDYRRTDGRRRRATLDRAGKVPLAKIRKMAEDWKHQIRNETDPMEQRQEKKEAPTLEQAATRFFDEYAPERMRLGRMSKKTVREYRILWRCHISPKLGNLKVAEIERRHIERAVAKLPPGSRNCVLTLLSRLFNLFEVWDYRKQQTNPCRGVERARMEPRDRTLSAGELGKLANALKNYEGNPAAVAAIRIAALTGLRISEVLAMQWEHVDLETGRLLLPETKTGRRWHDLPAPALDVLKGLPRKSEFWVLSATGNAPCGYRNVRHHFQQVAKAAGIKGIKLHDLRRTVMTLAAASGVGSHVLRDLLGHKSTAAADRYIRSISNPVKEAREQVGAQIASAMEG